MFGEAKLIDTSLARNQRSVSDRRGNSSAARHCEVASFLAMTMKQSRKEKTRHKLQTCASGEYCLVAHLHINVD